MRFLRRPVRRLLLALDAPSGTIDCFDISNLQGTNVVASRVRFRAGHPDKSGYRTSQLDSIPGVGDVKRKALLRRFGSVAGVHEASVEQLAAVPGIGPELARTILDALQKR